MSIRRTNVAFADNIQVSKMAQTTYKVYSGSIKIGTITGRNITSAKRKAIKKWGIYVW